MGCSVINCILFIVEIIILKGFETTPTSPRLTTDVNDVFVNSSITLTCATSSPPDYVVWFKSDKGSGQPNAVITQKWNNEKKSCHSDKNIMECFCSSSNAYACSIKSINRTNDDQSWLCKAIYGSAQIQSDSFTFRLILPVTTLTILPETSVAYPVFNVTSTFTCITSLSRPAASIYWFNDKNNITHFSTYSQNDDVTRSELHFISTANGYSGGLISCVANYEFKSLSKMLTANISIQVQFPVSKPIVTINNLIASTALVIREGRLVHLKCLSSGHPQPSYNWTYSDGWATGSLLNITFARNNANVSCKAFNVMRTLDGTNSAQVTEKTTTLNINVLYPPVITTLTSNDNNIDIIDSAIRVLRGDDINVVCTSDANPPAMVLWRDQRIQSPTLHVKSEQHDAVWTCQASNSMTDFDGVTSTSTVTKNVSASVLYPPDVQRLQNQTVLLNTSLTVLCNLTDVGNPPASTFSWIRMDNRKVVGNLKTLTLNNIVLADEGEYQCNTSNRMQSIGNEVVYGFSQSTFFINVEYGAFIQEFKANQSVERIIVEQGETVELLCYADGDPEPVVRVMNTTRGNQSALVEIEGHEAKYRIQQAQCEYDNGNYTCSANNRYNEGRQLFALFVSCSPRASPFSPPIKTLYRALNDDVLFIFTIIAYPYPKPQNVVWYKQDDDSWRVLSDPTNFMNTVSDDSMQIQLKIVNVQLADYTNYMVNVSNELGSTVEVFTLKAQSKPDVPTDLQVIRRGKTELIVEWIPGFDGGDIQTFTIRYKALDDESWTIIPLSISHYTWAIERLKTGTAYQIQILAQNKIGKSDWTQEINITTLVDIVSSGLSTSALGGAVGGVFGVVVIIAVSALIYRYRSNVIARRITKRTSLTKYEDLIRGQGNNDASTTDGSYAICRIESSRSRNANQFETLMELESRDYSIMSECNAPRDNTTSAKISASGQPDVSTTDPDYVNLQLLTY
ncbi:nephrin-like [Dreissena polymorpha]|uniref:nephrin-like n=1 Tax=Dreissena polymorpha TaxID=45954 RepID=UPI00226562B5|nr:nephrin-like [Dreissena polymorpha]